jgi:hypothetical protein
MTSSLPSPTFQPDLSEFQDFAQQVGLELYSKDQWDAVTDNSDSIPFLNLEANEMYENVYSTAYQRRPELFDSIRWINDEAGLPIWVKPGVEWESCS